MSPYQEEASAIVMLVATLILKTVAQMPIQHSLQMVYQHEHILAIIMELVILFCRFTSD